MMRNILKCSIIFSLCSFIYAEWQSIGLYGTNLRTMAQASTDENIIYTASGIGISDITVNPTSPDILYGACMPTGSNFSMGFLQSTDSGETWTCIPLNSNMCLGDVNSLIIDPAASDTVYAGTNSGVYFYRLSVNNVICTRKFIWLK
jgi:hypothetical protein